MIGRLKKFWGFSFLLLAIAVRILFYFYPILFETVYFNGAWPAIRFFLSAIDFIWVVPGFYFIIAFILVWLIAKRPRNRDFKTPLRHLANLLGATSTLFLVLWGFNYADRGLADRASLPELPATTDLSDEYLQVMDRAIRYRSMLELGGPSKTIEDYRKLPSDSAIITWVQNTLRPCGYPVSSTVRIRQFKPAGTLRRLSISGIYNPFMGEANVDGALTSLPLIFTTAHEVAHAYGVTGEGEANFCAYLSCLNSGVAVAAYAAEYALWRQIASEINKTYPRDLIESLAEAIPLELSADRRAILLRHFQYKGYFPELSDAINDTYLKIQGIESGTEDYDGFLQLYLRWADDQAPLMGKY